MILDETTDLSIRELERRLEFGVGTIYNYFPRKDELIQVLFQGEWERAISGAKGDSHYADDTGRPPYPVRREALLRSCEAYRPLWCRIGWEDRCEIDHYTVCLVTTAHRLIAVFPEEHERNIAFLRGLIAKGEHESATE